ncbi:MAG: hypothetical protein ACPL0A_03830 [Candidatus Micrarchaeia archaeon]
MKPREFWNEIVTEKSWELLVALSKEYDFIVIGGWAAYLWTRVHKSKDIDIVVDYETLRALKAKFSVNKNERLSKYEIKTGEFDIDIYVPGYSKLAVPVELILEHVEIVEGMKVPAPEVIVLLKQGAEIARRGSSKGKKDLIDILTLLIYSGFSVSKYRSIAEKLRLKAYVKELENEVRAFSLRDLEYLGMDVNEFAKWKRNFLRELLA